MLVVNSSVARVWSVYPQKSTISAVKSLHDLNVIKTNKPTNQPTNNKQINQPTEQLPSQPVSQPTNQTNKHKQTSRYYTCIKQQTRTC
jgi:hypothetical protein